MPSSLGEGESQGSREMEWEDAQSGFGPVDRKGIGNMGLEEETQVWSQ